MISIYVGAGTLPQGLVTELLDSEQGIPFIIETLQSPSLFGERKTYRITNIIADDVKKEFLEEVSRLGETAHDAVIIFEKLLAADRKLVADHITIHEAKIVKTSQDTSTAFALANTFATGDRKKTWIMFHELLSHDDEMEKMHGMLWWKIKDMMQKRSLFSKSELESMARTMVDVYHESRLGGLNLKERLEKFLLTLPQVKK